MQLLKIDSKKAPKGNLDERAYAVGDIHGCYDELIELLQIIKRDCEYRFDAKTHLIFLGDLVDRGPKSKDVVDLLMRFPYGFAEPHFIMGNHEEMMLRGLSGEPQLLPDWLKYGGFECAESYGIERIHLEGQDPEFIKTVLLSAIPIEHINFLAEFLEYIRFGDFLFTHAGIRPGVPLERQKSAELRWIREPFLNYQGTHGVVVIHGHTISDEVEVKPNRIGIDTGAYKTGRLSAVCIENDEVSFLST